MSWEEFGSLTDNLAVQLLHSGIRFTVVAPLLRTGGVVGTMLAVRFRIVTMLPVQFKNFYNPSAIKQMLPVPDILIPEGPLNILLCEGNTSSGATATAAAEKIKEKYPEANIYLATATKVFGGPAQLPQIERIFYGRLTDENFVASKEEILQYDLRQGITIFPWEHSEDELADINVTA